MSAETSPCSRDEFWTDETAPEPFDLLTLRTAALHRVTDRAERAEKERDEARASLNHAWVREGALRQSGNEWMARAESAEAKLAQVEALLEPTRVQDAISGSVMFIDPIHVRARNLRALLTPASVPSAPLTQPGSVTGDVDAPQPGNGAQRCHADRDGECGPPRTDRCPQLRDGEPGTTGRHCPLDVSDEGR